MDIHVDLQKLEVYNELDLNVCYVTMSTNIPITLNFLMYHFIAISRTTTIFNLHSFTYILAYYPNMFPSVINVLKFRN